MAAIQGAFDLDGDETREWLDSLEFILKKDGVDRANFLLERLSARMTQTGARLPYTITTPYRNTIPSSQEFFMPGDLFMERRIRSLIRWNALAMVVRSNQRQGDSGRPHLQFRLLRHPLRRGVQLLLPRRRWR